MNSEPTRNVVLAGGTGFLGSALANHFGRAGWKTVILTRGQLRSRRREEADRPMDSEGPPPHVGGYKSAQHVHWDGKTIGEWVEHLNGCDALINLAGRSVNCRFTPEHRKEILESRIDATSVLGQAISACDKPPSVWLNCSGVGIYNQSFDNDIDESITLFTEAETGTSFMGHVALLLERALLEANTPRTRKIALRISMVLGRHKGSPFTILRRLAKLSLAGTMGNGRQFVSWIHERDFCRAAEWLIESQNHSGPVNITAPQPVPNAEFMRALRRACGSIIGLPAPAWALKIGAVFTRTEPALVLDSRRVVPATLLSSGFKFDFPTCASALSDLAARNQK